jgi:hypothetical protein
MSETTIDSTKAGAQRLNAGCRCDGRVPRVRVLYFGRTPLDELELLVVIANETDKLSSADEGVPQMKVHLANADAAKPQVRRARLQDRL